MNEIRLIVLDIDGPSVTFCTGRPAPYLEVLLQAVDGHLPGVYENGAGIYDPVDYQFIPLPQIDQFLNGFAEITSRLEETLIKDKTVYFQPGKQHSLTIFPVDPSRIQELKELTAQALGPLSEQVDLVYSTSCLNILPRGVDKGKGLTFLADMIKIPMENMLGIGDSDVDLPFLQLVGHSAAPSNGNSNVKEMVEYISEEATSEGVREILTHFKLIK
jgi:HAD superfamily hydrolase (TIGR01484 family)